MPLEGGLHSWWTHWGGGGRTYSVTNHSAARALPNALPHPPLAPRQFPAGTRLRSLPTTVRARTPRIRVCVHRTRPNPGSVQHFCRRGLDPWPRPTWGRRRRRPRILRFGDNLLHAPGLTCDGGRAGLKAVAVAAHLGVLLVDEERVRAQRVRRDDADRRLVFAAGRVARKYTAHGVHAGSASREGKGGGEPQSKGQARLRARAHPRWQP